jgi:preprotein translocase subunit Sec61beta
MSDKINLPSGFGGLLRFSEEYKSKIRLKPSYIIGFVIAIAIFSILLKLFFPTG